MPQEASCCGGPTTSLWPRGGLLLGLFPLQVLAFWPQSEKARPQEAMKRKRDVYECASCCAKRELVPLV